MKRERLSNYFYETLQTKKFEPIFLQQKNLLTIQIYISYNEEN